MTPNCSRRSHQSSAKLGSVSRADIILLSQTRKWGLEGSLGPRAAKWGSLDLSLGYQIMLESLPHPFPGSFLSCKWGWDSHLRLPESGSNRMDLAHQQAGPWGCSAQAPHQLCQATWPVLAWRRLGIRGIVGAGETQKLLFI